MFNDGKCKWCGEPKVLGLRYALCPECYSNYHTPSKGNAIRLANTKKNKSWVGYRMADIKHIEYREKEAILKAHSKKYLPLIMAIEADEILKKYYKPAKIRLTARRICGIMLKNGKDTKNEDGYKNKQQTGYESRL